jgi:ABC-type transport system substrate-binding protein
LTFPEGRAAIGPSVASDKGATPRAVRPSLVAAFSGNRAQPQGQSLNLAVAAPPTSLDPHYHTLSPNNMMAEHFFDQLVGRDARMGASELPLHRQ